MHPDSSLDLTPAARAELWTHVAATMEHYSAGVDAAPVAPACDPAEVRRYVDAVDFAQPLAPHDAIEHAAQGLWRYHLHTAHRRYFGLFNPTPAAMGIAADALTAAFNPQLAAWAHAPFAVEVERRLLREFAGRLGFDPAAADGTFTSGGAEANHTAVVTALLAAFPAVAREGLRALAGQPTLYVSDESHHSFVKAARACGLGTDAVRRVAVDDSLRMWPDALAATIEGDRAAGCLPFLVVATAGTTSAGAIDPLPDVADVAAAQGLWLHADAAWGGAAALVPELRGALAGIERADSVTLDAHKWLSVPMAAGMFLTRRRDALPRAFAISAAYVPPNEAGDTVDPYAHSMQWSRRFIGLKLFLSLAVAGWEGYAAALRHQTAMGDLLRAELVRGGWRVINETPLPVVCFEDTTGADADAVVRAVVASGDAWVSSTRVGAGRPALRACVTSYRTGPEDVRTLVRALDDARRRVRVGTPRATSSEAASSEAAPRLDLTAP